jgi:NADP+-dependent farnesol dehydrogenase
VIFTVFQELSKSLKSANGKLYALKCDASKESDVQAAFKWVKDNLGGVDILVNNAAVAYNTSLISKSPQQLSCLLNFIIH